MKPPRESYIGETAERYERQLIAQDIEYGPPEMRYEICGHCGQRERVDRFGEFAEGCPRKAVSHG